ncbi:LysR family transcriptional regulator [Xanthomonas phaseoli]|nr:LysR family transcriptional regulator [Xanthomonas phaseoli]MBO9788642.1 LysR family transcriptional regulator [Xanthomonas phaseoli pv. dieffenbachiae]MBO9887144.1 LysR family transcriptional regulator [Xanthomonas phaseoli pv. dieffenbachiae]MBO9916085.1 LysR family transcriptional regulator [Xanthomonas phaseoli pv. dieffenbachiae]MBO9937729.1 LysR family transcriptional regulator [Xanthomonas phaseoli pv. dieffenbachiae]MBO9996290.1 LysR family transcriptional regulator [Xanthomonas pha
MNIRPSDLPLLVSLDALLELKNVTHAAQRLHMSQPALSSQLARLRVLFKDPLLMPSDTGRGMVATPRADQLASPLREAIGKLSLLGKDSAFDPSMSSASFRIAAADAIGTLGAGLAGLIQAQGNPKMRLEFVHVGADTHLDAFESGELDLLIDHAQAVPAALRLCRLRDERYVLVQRRGHPRGTAALSAASYSRLSHVQVAHAQACNLAIDAQLRQLGHARQIAVTVSQCATARDIVLGTDMVATVPATLAAESGYAPLDCFELPFPLPDMALAMAWHRRNDGHAAHRWLRERVLELLAPEVPAAPAAPPASRRTASRGDLVLSVS